MEASPDTFEANVRTRIKSKQNVLRTIVEERIATANRTRPRQLDLSKVNVGDKGDLYRTPDHKGQEGWRGPCDLLHLKPSGAIVMWNGYPYIVPLRRIRLHQKISAFHADIAVTSTSSFPATTLLLEDHQDMLDIIEGSIPFKVYICGQIIGQDGVKRYTPADLQSSPPRVWNLVKEFVEQ